MKLFPRTKINRRDFVKVAGLTAAGSALLPIPVGFTVTGAGELAAAGSPAPNDAACFHLPVHKTYQGRGLAILRPQGGSGKITLKAEADGVKAATIVVQTR